MNLGMGLSIRRRSAAFTPESLFADGTAGIWLDTSDVSRMWQESTKATQVASAADPVGYVAKRAGTVDGFQQDTAGRIPVYRLSGSVGYVEMDSTPDDALYATGTLSLTTESTHIIVFDKLVDASTNMYIMGATESDTPYISANSNETVDASAGGYVAGAGAIFGAASIAASGWTVVSVRRSSAQNLIQVYAGQTKIGETTHTTTSATWTPTVNGYGAKGVSGPQAMYWGGSLAINKWLTDTELANTITFMGARVGLTL